METEGKYVTVGTFVLIVVAMGIGFVLWYTNASEGRKYNPYEIYFDGSVSGLDQGGAVRYLGVDVGRVRRLTIDRQGDKTRVKVMVEIDSTAPISSATRASLDLQGVTGLLFINLKEVPDVDAHKALPTGERYPVIDSVQSNLDALLSSLPTLVGRATVLIDRVNGLFSDANLTAFNETVENIHASSKGLPQTAARVAALVDELKSTVKVINSAAADLQGMTTDARPQVQQSLQQIDQIGANLARASERLDKLVAGSETQLGHFTDQGLFQLERLLRDSRAAAREFRELSRSLKENPSQFLYEPHQSGVDVPP